MQTNVMSDVPQVDFRPLGDGLLLAVLTAVEDICQVHEVNEKYVRISNLTRKQKSLVHVQSFKWEG